MGVVLLIAAVVFIVYALPVAAALAAIGACYAHIVFKPAAPLREDLICYMKRQNKRLSLINCIVAILGDNALQAVFLYRVSNALFRRRLGFVANMVRRLGIALTGADFSPTAQIGPGLEVFHGIGIVVGKTARLGNNIWLCQGVSIGHSGSGTCPVLHNNVKIFAGAAVIGEIEIGENAVIGANTVVIKSVPANAMVIPPEPTVKENPYYARTADSA